MERNAIIATALVIAILIGYQWYLSEFEAPPPPAPREQTTTASAPTPAAAPAAVPTPAPPLPRPETVAPQAKRFPAEPPAGTPARDIIVDTPLYHVVFSTAGARAVHWELKKYRLEGGAPVDLVAQQPLGTGQGPLEGWVDGEPEAGAAFRASQDRIDLAVAGQSATLTFKRSTESGIEIQKQLTFYADRYPVDVALSAKNLSGQPVTIQPHLAWGPGFRDDAGANSHSVKPPTLWVDGKRVEQDLSKVSGQKVVHGDISWAALEDTYFAAALLPKEKGMDAFVQKVDGHPMVGLTLPQQNLAAGAEVTLRAQVFGGPKDLQLLKSAGQNLDELVNLGWFTFLARPALWLLKFLFNYTGNYGVAIILVTILQKIAFHPLTVKSMKSMKAMQAVQPKVQAIQERFKNNPQKKQEETMALYRKYGVNPMGGCLPMLVQIPIFIALYDALGGSVEMWQAHFLWIRDLTKPDTLFTMTIWGGRAFPFNLLAILMGISMFLQQKMSPTSGDPRQAKMMLWTMPIVFTFMFWGFPSGLVLYWLVNNVLQVGQQWLINRTPATPAVEGQAA